MGILQTGFKNVKRGNSITGFQIPVVNSYYRGTYISLTEGFDITVDGETFPRDQVTCTFGSITITQDEFDGIMERWQFLKPAILTVSKAGGLKPGLHEIKVVVTQRISYMAANPFVKRTFEAKLAIVE